MTMTETARLATVLTLKDGLSSGLDKTIGKVAKFDKGLGQAGKGVGQLGGGLAKAGAKLAVVAGVGLGLAAKAAIDWQDAFQGVVKTVDEADLKSAGLSFDDIADGLRAMAREMPNSATELAGIAEQAGALGVKGKDILAFTKQVAILASTTNVSADDAATALGQLSNVIGLTADDYDNFAASLVDLGNKGASTEADILEIARRAGGAAKLFGIAKDQTLGWAAAAANLGLNSELAGTSLQNAFLKVMPKVAEGSKTLSDVMGKSAKDIRHAFKKDASGAMEELLRDLGKMPKDARLAAVQKIFGKGSGLTRLILGLADSVDKNLDPALKDSTKSWKEATAAQIEFDKRNATVASAIKRLRHNIEDAAISIGEGMVPALGRAADKLSKFLGQDANRSKLKKIGEDIGRAIDSIDFDRLLKTADGVVSALKPAVGILLKITEAIGKLPPELLGAGGALVITNKLSGGLVIKGFEGVIEGLGGSLAKGLAASIPLFGKLFVQPVFVTNQGFGGGGGPSVPNPIDEVDDAGKKVGLLELIRRAFSGLSGGGATVSLDMVEAQKHTNSLLEQVRAEQARRNGATPGLTGGAPGRGGAKPSPGLTGGAPGRGISAVGKKIGELHHAAIPAINGVGAKVTAEKGALERAQHSGTHVLGAKIGHSTAAMNDVRHAVNSVRTSTHTVGAKVQRSTAAMNDVRHAVNGVRSTTSSKLGAANAKLDGIRHKKTSFSTHVNVSTAVSVRTTQGAMTTSSRYRSATNTHGT